MLKDILIIALIGQTVVTTLALIKNIEQMKKLESITKHLVYKVEAINMDKVGKEVIEEVKKQLWNLSFTGIKIK